MRCRRYISTHRPFWQALFSLFLFFIFRLLFFISAGEDPPFFFSGVLQSAGKTVFYLHLINGSFRERDCPLSLSGSQHTPRRTSMTACLLFFFQLTRAGFTESDCPKAIKPMKRSAAPARQTCVFSMKMCLRRVLNSASACLNLTNQT